MQPFVDAKGHILLQPAAYDHPFKSAKQTTPKLGGGGAA